MNGACRAVTWLRLVFSPTIRNTWPKAGTPSSGAAAAGRGAGRLTATQTHRTSSTPEVRQGTDENGLDIVQSPSALSGPQSSRGTSDSPSTSEAGTYLAQPARVATLRAAVLASAPRDLRYPALDEKQE